MIDERRRVDTGVGSLAVRIIGEGLPAVLWHSLFVDERSWDRMLDDLAKERLVIVITGPGHGASTDPGHRYSMDGCAEAAATVLDAVGVHGAVDWVGNAWGGHVGVTFAARWPDRCRSLVMIGAPLQALGRYEYARTSLLTKAYRILGMRRFLQDAVIDTMLSPRTRETDPTAVQLVRDCLTDADPAGLRNAINSISLHRPDSIALLPDVPAATLIITGPDQKSWTPQQADAACRLLPNGSTAIIPNTAYLAPLEAPVETAQLVSQFWAKHPLRTATT